MPPGGSSPAHEVVAERAGVERAVALRVRRTFPVHARLLGEGGLAELARLAVERAAQHEITAPAGVGSFATTMVMLGSDFARDPLLPWAGELLAERDVGPPSRAERLQNATLDFLDQTAGCHNEALGAALKRIREHPFLADPTGEALPALMERLHPERAGAMPTAALAGLEARAADVARRHGFEDPRAVPMFATCLFELGAGFDTDPQFPWARAALAAEAEESFQRLMGFYVAAMIHVDRLRSAATTRR